MPEPGGVVWSGGAYRVALLFTLEGYEGGEVFTVVTWLFADPVQQAMRLFRRMVDTEGLDHTEVAIHRVLVSRQKLKCPFCGVTLRRYRVDGEPFVACDDCGISGTADMLARAQQT